jgi:hypothetical protein
MISENKTKNAYEEIELAVSSIMANQSQNNLDSLKTALNELFPDAKCKNVIYTENTDKLFFGLFIMPEIDEDQVIKIITDDRRYRVKEYELELDGKLFGSYLGLNREQITALIVHDVGALTNNSAPSEEVVKALDKYLIDHNETLKISDVVHYKKILSYGFRDSLRKCTSIFELGYYNAQDDTFADFITWIDYKGNIQSALEKIDRLGYNTKKNITNRFVTLAWVMRIYRDVLGYRISAIKSLERLQELTPSRIESHELANFAKRLTRIDDDMLLESYGYTSLALHEDEMIDMMRKAKFPIQTNVMDCLDIARNDLVGTLLKKNNLDSSEPDAIPDLVHSINTSMMHMQDYIDHNVSPDDKEVYKQWNNIFKEMDRCRKQLSKGKHYVQSKTLLKKYKSQVDQ